MEDVKLETKGAQRDERTEEVNKDGDEAIITRGAGTEGTDKYSGERGEESGD